jgi:hypothetical protein
MAMTDAANPGQTSQVQGAQPQAPDRKTKPSTWARTVQKGVFIFLILFICAVFLSFAVALPVVVYTFDKTAKTVKSVQPAGKVMTVSLSAGLMTRALVETDSGYFSLLDGVSLAKGMSLLLEERVNGDRYLCDDQKHCTRLM